MEEIEIAREGLFRAFGIYNWKICSLGGGLSGAKVFLAEHSINKYVVKLLKCENNQDKLNIINNNKQASAAKYEPAMHFYDNSLGVMIFDYLKPEPFNLHQKIPELVVLLKKIHSCGIVNVSERIWECMFPLIRAFRLIKQDIINIDKLEFDFKRAAKSAESFGLSLTVCHRDLNPSNIIFSGGQLFAVDHDSRGVDDPNLDLATLLIFCPSLSETELLERYLGRAPANFDVLKLCVYKKIVLMRYGMCFLDTVCYENWSNDSKILNIKDFFRALVIGEVSFQNEIDRMKCGLMMLREAEKY